MADTNAIYFANEFNNNPLLINTGIPSATTITLNNNGAHDIFIGKYTKGIMPFSLNASPDRFRICGDSISPNFTVNNPNSNTTLTYRWQPSTNMSDGAILNPKVFIAADSLLSTLTISDNNGYHFSKTFVFYRAEPINFHLVLSPLPVCRGSYVTVSVEGTGFAPCYVSSNPYEQSPWTGYIHSINQISGYRPEQSHTITLYDSATRQCIGTEAYYVQVKPIQFSYRNYHVCPGTDYTFPDNTSIENIQGPVNQYSYFTSANGCDSIINTQLYVLPVTPVTINNIICAGTNYTFPDGTLQNNIVADITHTSHLFAISGCDSITITTNLTVNPSYTSSQAISLCTGSNYTFPDGHSETNIATNISYTSNFTSLNGCDSSITTNITINPPYSSTINVSVCSGSSYTFPDGTTQSNIVSNSLHTSNLHSVSGCDSIINTNLLLYPLYQSVESITVCAGSSYTFPDDSTINNINSDIIHTSHFINSNGCDSSIITTITVFNTDTNVVKNGRVLTANTTDAGYQWLDCSNAMTAITDSVSRSFIASAIGSYAIEITNQGCKDTSSCYAVSFDDFRVGNNPMVTVYPVPVRNTINLTILSATPATVQISIFDFYGRRVRNATAILHAGANVISQSVSSLAGGSYTLQLINSVTGEKIVKRIIKN